MQQKQASDLRRNLAVLTQTIGEVSEADPGYAAGLKKEREKLKQQIEAADAGYSIPLGGGYISLGAAIDAQVSGATSLQGIIPVGE